MQSMMIRSVLLLGLIAGFGLGCAAKSKLDYCDCEMWGVRGAPPPPDWQPPPRPAACERILKRQPEQNCPIPP